MGDSTSRNDFYMVLCRGQYVHIAKKVDILVCSSWPTVSAHFKLYSLQTRHNDFSIIKFIVKAVL